MLPAVVAFLGAFDSTHEVLVMGNRASTTVVFHHQTKEAEALERHSLLMQVFTVVAATSGESNDRLVSRICGQAPAQEALQGYDIRQLAVQ